MDLYLVVGYADISKTTTNLCIIQPTTINGFLVAMAVTVLKI